MNNIEPLDRKEITQPMIRARAINRILNLFSEWFTTEDVPPMTLDEAVDLWWTEIRWFDHQWSDPDFEITHNGILWRDE